jgi:ribonuclease BN (tRNA processing enzyme)
VLLTVLGCSGSVPGPNLPTSGYLLEAADARLVLDLGIGTLAALQAIRDPFAVSTLLFTHLHADHCSDFSALAVLRRYHPAPPVDPRAERLPVYGPSDLPARLAGAYAPSAADVAETNLSDVFTFLRYPVGPADVAGFTVTAAVVDHPCESYGLRIERAGRSLCYTGDSGPCASLERLAAGVDVLLAEASWTDEPDRPPNLHLSGRQAGELAAKAGVGRLVVTHVQPWTDRDAVLAEARAAFPGDVVLATPAARFQV